MHFNPKLKQGRGSKYYKLKLHVCIFVPSAWHANRTTSRHVLTVSVSGYSCQRRKRYHFGENSIRHKMCFGFLSDSDVKPISYQAKFGEILQ